MSLEALYGVPAPRKPLRSRRLKTTNVKGKKCVLCGRTDKQAGKLERAHLNARSKGGGITYPMCPNCHTRYDVGKATARDLRKLHITRKQYKRFLPRRRQKRRNPKKINQISVFELPRIEMPRLGF